MPGFNPFRYRFPYTNINDINLDWIIKKVRKLSEDVAAVNPERIEEVAQQAAAAEQTAQDALETAEGVSGIASDAETIARTAQTTANNAADSAQAAGTAAAAAQTTADEAGAAAAAAQTTADAAGTAAAAAQTTANQNRVAIAIVANGNTAPQNILEGQYVVWYGGLYSASSAIASGATLSGSNLTAVTGGGLNNLLLKGAAVRLRSTDSLDTIAGSGLFYGFGGDPVHNTPNGLTFCLVQIQRHPDGTGVQIWIDNNNGFYFRLKFTTGWQPWRSISSSALQ